MSKQQPTTVTYSLMTQVILLQHKTETSNEDLATFFKGVQALQQHIPCLVAVGTGENQSTRHRGFTHGILLHFENEARMRNAMQQPIYQRMLERAQQLSEGIIVLELPETLSFPARGPEVGSLSANTSDATSSKSGRSSRTRSTPSPRARETESHGRLNMDELLRRYPITSIDSRLKQLAIDQFGVEESEVIPAASLVEDLNADSLDLVEYIMSLEQLFQITISDEDAEKLTTIAETQVYLIAKGALAVAENT